MRYFCGGLLAALAALATIAQRVEGAPQTWRDDFATRAAGSDATPAWEPETVGWEIRDGGYQGDAGTSVWRAAPLGAMVTFACDVTVLEQLKGDWLTAGIGLATDDANYWAVQLVVAPERLGRSRMAEMHESLAAHWLAESESATRLVPRPGNHGWHDWQINKTYRFEIQLTAGQGIVGRISQAGKDLAQFGFAFKSGVAAVQAGRPVLRARGLRVRFANASVTVHAAAAEPPVVKKTFPPWTPRGGAPIARASGFFRTALIEAGRELAAAEAAQPDVHPQARWWLVDPAGEPLFDVGTDHVNYRAHWCEALGYAPYHRNVAARFGSEEAWATSAIARLVAWGFNTLPAGHSPSLRHRGLPHILFASFGSGFAPREWIAEPIHWTGFPDVFSPHWPAHCRIVARRMAAEGRGDPWCLGTFLDNELEWYGKHGYLVDEIFKLGPAQPAKKALYDWLLRRHGSLKQLNERLRSDYAGQQAFLAATAVPPASAALDEARDGFLAEIAERYFAVAAGAMRQADPEHLVLGCRFAGRAPAAALAAAGKYNDVFTFNTYPRVDFENVWRADGTGGVVERVPRELTEMYRVVRRPMIITEWSFPALDSGLPCKHGAGMRVDTQQQKAACYRIFANAMADLPFMVGYHYFMWADEPAPGISSTFPEDSNYGLVNEKDEPYQTLVQTAAEVNRLVAERHARSVFSGDLELRAAGGAVRLSNADAMPARGRLQIIAGGASRIEEIVVPPHGARTLNVGSQTASCVELQRWDGSRERALCGWPPRPLEVANLSAATLDRVPVVLDGPPVVAAVTASLAPGQTVALAPPAGALAETDRLELHAGPTTWQARRGEGSLFDGIRAGDLPLGRLAFAAHQQWQGHEGWTEANRTTSLRVQEQPDAWIVEALVERAGPARQGPPHFQAALRAAIFKRGGLALVKPLWLENTDSRPWQMVEAFWFCRSAIGGSTADDVVDGPNVPNYYRTAQFCTDSKLGGCFGALGQSGGWQTAFWQDRGGIHPDTRYGVHCDLRPGQRWTADGVPYLWIFALRDAAGWRDVAALHRQAQRLFAAGAEK
jgi:hypothetical protein